MTHWRKNLIAVLFGVLVITLVELGLSAAKFNPPACGLDPYASFKGEVPFLVETESDGQRMASINPALARHFNPVSFPLRKTAATRRIFVLGGSDVLGFPFLDQGSFSRFLALGLQALDQSREYQVVNLGGFGYASYRVERVFRDALNFQPDLIIVMTGHNEFLEKREYPAPGKRSPLQEKLSRLKIYCALKSALFKLHAPERPLASRDVKWERFTLEPEMRGKIIGHYRFNLAEMARLGQEAKVPVLLLTSPSNLKDFPPFHSQHRRDMTPAELAEWEKYEKQSQALLSAENFAEAVPALQQQIILDPEYARSYYDLGLALLKAGPEQDAIYAFEIALAKDAWQVRALPEFNAFILSLEDQAKVLDLGAIFEAASPQGVPGRNLFYDHCHPRLQTQALIAKEILRKLAQDNILSLPRDWEKIYDHAADNYIDSMPRPVLAQAYWRLALEIGVNMRLEDLGREYLRLGLALDPENPNLKELAKKLDRR